MESEKTTNKDSQEKSNVEKEKTKPKRRGNKGYFTDNSFYSWTCIPQGYTGKKGSEYYYVNRVRLYKCSRILHAEKIWRGI